MVPLFGYLINNQVTLKDTIFQFFDFFKNYYLLNDQYISIGSLTFKEFNSLQEYIFLIIFAFTIILVFNG